MERLWLEARSRWRSSVVEEFPNFVSGLQVMHSSIKLNGSYFLAWYIFSMFSILNLKILHLMFWHRPLEPSCLMSVWSASTCLFIYMTYEHKYVHMSMVRKIYTFMLSMAWCVYNKNDCFIWWKQLASPILLLRGDLSMALILWHFNGLKLVRYQAWDYGWFPWMFG